MEDFLEEITNEDIDINIPTEAEEFILEEKPPIYSLLGIEMPFEEFDHLICEQNKGKELVVENGKVIARVRVATQEELNQQKLAELENWFDNYFDKQLNQSLWQDDFAVSHDNYFNKDYNNIEELKAQAKIVRDEIRELRK